MAGRSLVPGRGEAWDWEAGAAVYRPPVLIPGELGKTGWAHITDKGQGPGGASPRDCVAAMVNAYCKCKSRSGCWV